MFKTFAEKQNWKFEHPYIKKSISNFMCFVNSILILSVVVNYYFIKGHMLIFQFLFCY